MRDRIEIEIGGQKNNNGTIVFIKDNGIGFDMSFKEKLFKPFQRLHNESDYAGYGIGLATVFRIIERHGGRIWAESEVGKGTTMFFELPN